MMGTTSTVSARGVELRFGRLSMLAAVLTAFSAIAWPQGQDRAGAGGPGTRPREQRFTLRLGQGFRFRDARVVTSAEDRPDVVFKYVPPYVGGMATRYNPISQQVEVGLEPTLTSPMPLLLATYIRSFEQAPDLTSTTSGDIASYDHQTAMSTNMRHVLLMNVAGDQYLLRLVALEAPPGNYDAWSIEFAAMPVQLPLGTAGGKVNRPLPGRLVYRDWYRTKMVMSVDLTTGKEEALADGILPSVSGNRWLGYGDSSGAYVVRDAAGKVRHSIRFQEQVLGPVLAGDGMRLLGSVYRPGPEVCYGNVRLPGAAVLAVGIFDSQGREIVAIPGYDDANWTPDGNLIATGKLTDPGLFELDPRTRTVRTVAAGVASPSQPCISADGRTIAFITGNRIWLIDRDGSNLRQVLPGTFSQQRPVFSPDGTKIAAVICNTIAADMTGEVFVIDLVTKEVTPLRTRTGQALVPDTSSRLHWLE